MVQKVFSVSIVLTLSFLLTGCAFFGLGSSHGKDFDESKVSQIQKGRTSQDGILALFGEPNNRGIANDGTAYWQYNYTRASAFGGSQKTLTINFDSNKIVKDFSLSTEKY